MNAFRLLVVAAVAAALIYVVMGLFQPSEVEIFMKLKAGIDYAEQNEGRLHETEIAYRAGFGLKAEALDSPSRSVRLECSSVGTCAKEKISIEPRSMAISEQALLRTYFRCMDKGPLNDCIIYFGDRPAQVELSSVEFTEPKGGSAAITFSVKNVGGIDAVDSVYAIKLYLKKMEGEEEKEVLRSEIRGLLKKLVPRESQFVRHQFEVLQDGRYALKVGVEGEDAGRAQWEKVFEVAEKPLATCAAGEKAATTLNNGVCRTQYACSGCETGAECSLRWQEKGLSETEITEAYKSGVYVEKPAQNGEC